MGIGTLKNNGILAETAEQKAEMLNNQFTSVFTTENMTNICHQNFLLLLSFSGSNMLFR
jgi:hypothetical protein